MIRTLLLAAALFFLCLGIVRASDADPCVVDGIDGARPCRINPGSN